MRLPAGAADLVGLLSKSLRYLTEDTGRACHDDCSGGSDRTERARCRRAAVASDWAPNSWPIPTPTSMAANPPPMARRCTNHHPCDIKLMLDPDTSVSFPRGLDRRSGRRVDKR